MFYEGLHFLKGLPSPEGVWERVQIIGELMRVLVGGNKFLLWKLYKCSAWTKV